ncbi:MAG: TetR/AcrR family transcriptional regulator [Mesorhizobium sp.]|uniref:TetR/AcrR family transcriptional regulator n=1 Tax=Mesorhizobium sp. TaxID=1871066 RepID=UPI00120557C8|nr:TetR/AcrR family transcriptional regulator [Mesorhizobium sp.]TIM31684.1 MAG: TetR/AcrR family transcriptional regulator [Mesorhizobium sp.]
MAKGLWEKHKIKRTEQVLDAADALFRDQGYEETKIEEIAELASVASATVYNYFKNKPNLLMEIALRHIRAAVPERREFIANMPDDPMDGIIEFEKLLADQAVRHLTPECWRVVMSAQFVDTDGVAHRTARRLDLIIRRQYSAILADYQRKERIRADVDISVLCDILIGIGNAALAKLVTSPAMQVETMREIGLPHLRLVLSGVTTSATQATN